MIIERIVYGTGRTNRTLGGVSYEAILPRSTDYEWCLVVQERGARPRVIVAAHVKSIVIGGATHDLKDIAPEGRAKALEGILEAEAGRRVVGGDAPPREAQAGTEGEGGATPTPQVPGSFPAQTARG